MPHESDSRKAQQRRLFHRRQRLKATQNQLPRRVAVDLTQSEWAVFNGATIVDENTFTLAAVATSVLDLKLVFDEVRRLLKPEQIFIFDGFLTLDAITGAEPWAIDITYTDTEGLPDSITVPIDTTAGSFPFELPFTVRQVDGSLTFGTAESTKSGTITVNRLRIRSIFPP